MLLCFSICRTFRLVALVSYQISGGFKWVDVLFLILLIGSLRLPERDEQGNKERGRKRGGARERWRLSPLFSQTTRIWLFCGICIRLYECTNVCLSVCLFSCFPSVTEVMRSNGEGERGIGKMEDGTHTRNTYHNCRKKSHISSFYHPRTHARRSTILNLYHQKIRNLLTPWPPFGNSNINLVCFCCRPGWTTGSHCEISEGE